MILIIGGSFQGKKAYAAQICKDGRILADFQGPASARYWKPGKIRKRLLDSFSQTRPR